MKLIYKNKRKTHSKHANEAVDKARQKQARQKQARQKQAQEGIQPGEEFFYTSPCYGRQRYRFEGRAGDVIVTIRISDNKYVQFESLNEIERIPSPLVIQSSAAYQNAYQAAQSGGMGNDESHEFAMEHATSKVDQNTGATFIGNMEPGAIFNSLRILGNFRRKKDAEGFISQSFNTAIEGYCNGKYSRGWVVYTAADTTERNGR